MPIDLDLILFEPSRNVLYGMPVFIGTRTRLLRGLLREHGEWSDNPSRWLAGYVGDPPHIELHCAFNANQGQRYARRLLPQLEAGSHAERSPKPPRGVAYLEAAAGSVAVPLRQAWFIHGNDIPQRVSATSPGPLTRQRRYWFPCDGALAVDTSALPCAIQADTAGMLEWLIAQSALVDALCARAECCFLLRLQPGTDKPPTTHAPLAFKRRQALQGRQGDLLEAHLPVTLRASANHGVTS